MGAWVLRLGIRSLSVHYILSFLVQDVFEGSFGFGRRPLGVWKGAIYGLFYCIVLKDIG